MVLTLWNKTIVLVRLLGDSPKPSQANQMSVAGQYKDHQIRRKKTKGEDLFYRTFFYVVSKFSDYLVIGLKSIIVLPCQ